MNKEKQDKLSEAGWKVGDAEEFLGMAFEVVLRQIIDNAKHVYEGHKEGLEAVDYIEALIANKLFPKTTTTATLPDGREIELPNEVIEEALTAMGVIESEARDG